MKAEIISIGTELLLGEIVDSNAAHIAQSLCGVGLDLYYKTTVGDNEVRIAEVIDHALNRVDVVITTGGLGPTVDDVTREGIAIATGCPLVFHQDLLDLIAEKFKQFNVKMSDNNRRQAYAPQGSFTLDNPVGTAPIFILETERGVVMVLPGVPREMKYLLKNNLLAWLEDYLGDPSVIMTRILRTAGLGESTIDDQIGDLMEKRNPTVGLAAHTGQTDIRITAKAANEDDAHHLIAPIEAELRERLGDSIYATGKESIESHLIKLLKEYESSVAAVEFGAKNMLSQRLAEIGDDQPIACDSFSTMAELREQYNINFDNTPEEVALAAAEAARQKKSADYGLSVILQTNEAATLKRTTVAVISATEQLTRTFSWTTERDDAAIWATTRAFTLLRKVILDSKP